MWEQIGIGIPSKEVLHSHFLLCLQSCSCYDGCDLAVGCHLVFFLTYCKGGIVLVIFIFLKKDFLPSPCR